MHVYFNLHTCYILVKLRSTFLTFLVSQNSKHPFTSLHKSKKSVSRKINISKNMAINMSKNESRRRFNDQQIQLLESMFETDSRPELKMKQRVAYRLGLQPRQVGIWFQNKRARSKLRQIEQEYCELKNNYQDLSSKFENLKRENLSLLTQLQSLRNVTPNHQGCKTREMFQKENSSSQGYNSGNITSVTEDQYNFLSEAYNQGIDVPNYENSGASVPYFTEEREILDMTGLRYDPSEVMENTCGYESNTILENTSFGSGWWKH